MIFFLGGGNPINPWELNCRTMLQMQPSFGLTQMKPFFMFFCPFWIPALAPGTRQLLHETIQEERSDTGYFSHLQPLRPEHLWYSSDTAYTEVRVPRDFNSKSNAIETNVNMNLHATTTELILLSWCWVRRFVRLVGRLRIESHIVIDLLPWLVDEGIFNARSALMWIHSWSQWSFFPAPTLQQEYSRKHFPLFFICFTSRVAFCIHSLRFFMMIFMERAKDWVPR